MQRDERERRRSAGQKELWRVGGGRVIIGIIFNIATEEYGVFYVSKNEDNQHEKNEKHETIVKIMEGGEDRNK